MTHSQPNIDVDEGNHLEIDHNSSYTSSRIIVRGTGNRIRLDGALDFNKLSINLRGDNKDIHIAASKAKINNLKITSIRENYQKLRIGKNFSCGGLEIQMNDAHDELIIGDDCLFSWGIKMRTSDGHSVVDLESNRAINLPKKIDISYRVWVGEDVRFLKGVIIPNDVVVGSGAVITKPFTNDDANTVIAGFPAKVVRRGVRWDRRMPAEFNDCLVSNLNIK